VIDLHAILFYSRILICRITIRYDNCLVCNVYARRLAGSQLLESVALKLKHKTVEKGIKIKSFITVNPFRVPVGEGSSDCSGRKDLRQVRVSQE